MAFLYITEYEKLGLDLNGGLLMAPKEPAVAHQKIAISGSAVQSAAFNQLTRFIRMEVDAICHIVVDKDATATTTHGRWAADQTEVRAVNGADKVSVIMGV